MWWFAWQFWDLNIDFHLERDLLRKVHIKLMHGQPVSANRQSISWAGIVHKLQVDLFIKTCVLEYILIFLPIVTSFRGVNLNVFGLLTDDIALS